MQAIERQDIESVNTLYGDRQRVIDQLYSSTSIEAAATRHLLQLNQQIVDQLNRLKLQTQRRQLDIRQGAKATKAYLDQSIPDMKR